VYGSFDLKRYFIGQAGAARHGLAKALQAWDFSFRPVLKTGMYSFLFLFLISCCANITYVAGFLTRDSRAVERKHTGKLKARKASQWSKR